jgi:hypothetical protein
MVEPQLNFARRPFRDDRPVYALAAGGIVLALALALANVQLYVEFQNQIRGTAAKIQTLEERRARAARKVETARAALNNYRVSSLARESQGLRRLVAERRFSWTGLLAALEHALPAEVRVARMTPSVSPTGTVTVALGLVGRSPESVVQTVGSLSRDPAFEGVSLKGETGPEQGVPEGYSFELAVAYRAEAAR